MKRMMKRQEAAEEARPRVQARERPKLSERASGSATSGRPKKPRTPPRQYVRESIAELKRVDWPTRHQVWVYTVVTLICVAALGTVIAAFDFGIGELIIKVFG